VLFLNDDDDDDNNNNNNVTNFYRRILWLVDSTATLYHSSVRPTAESDGT
jgi:hypothetical protein